MAKKPKNENVESKLGDGAADQSTDTGTTETKAPAEAKSRGPRGVLETAVITLVATANPKRAGSKAFAAFANYTNGMTVKEFADAVGKEATGHLVYDAKHGFITIEGYDPGAIIVAKPKAPPKAKSTKVKGADEVQAEVAEQAEAQAETME